MRTSSQSLSLHTITVFLHWSLLCFISSLKELSQRNSSLSLHNFDSRNSSSLSLHNFDSRNSSSLSLHNFDSKNSSSLFAQLRFKKDILVSIFLHFPFKTLPEQSLIVSERGKKEAFVQQVNSFTDPNFLSRKK